MSERTYTPYTRIWHCSECDYFMTPVYGYHDHFYKRMVRAEGFCPACGASLDDGIGRFYSETKRRSFLGFKWKSEGPIAGYELKDGKATA